jgi:hypothetical protein
MTKAAIIGTAPSWKLTPWADQDRLLVSLNDAYRMDGFVRADRWYDLHPLDKFVSVPPKALVYPHQVPPGHYVRPADHLQWLSRQAIPVYLHPGHGVQCPASATWPTARAFPRDAIVEHFGRYFTSSPAWMLAHLLMEGYTDIRIYGIHLATQHEYLEQRPQFEFLIGRALGAGKLTETVADGMRYYETSQAVIGLPQASPVLTSDFQYAFEPRPQSFLAGLEWDLHRYTVKRDRAVAQLATRPWWQTPVTVQRELALWDAYIGHTRDRLNRATTTWRG